jgi:hypothetical protein
VSKWILLLSACGLAAVCLPQVAPAQAIDTDRPAIRASDNDQRLGIASPGVALEAATDTSEISLTFTSKNSGKLQPGGQETWSIVAKAPLDKSIGGGDFVTEQGLSNQFALEAGYSLITDPGIGEDLPAAVETAVASFTQNCPEQARQQEAYPKAESLTSEEEALSEDVKRYVRLRKSEEAKRVQDAFVDANCSPEAGILNLPEATLVRLGKLGTGDLTAIRDYHRRRRNRDIAVLNLTGSIGYAHFGYFDPISFLEEKANKTSYSFSLSAGIHPAKTAPFFGAGYEYKREFKAGDKQVICPAAAGTAPITCRNEVFAAPTADTSHNIFALVRYADFSETDSARFRIPLAIELRAAYDIKDNIFGIVVPAYFLMGEDKSFRGGVKFSWAERTKDSRRDEFKFGVFIVKALDLFAL